MDALTIISIFGAILIVFVAVAIYAMMYSKGHRALVLYPTSGKVLPQEVRMYDKKDKISGVIWWKSFDGKHKFPEPPEQCVTHLSGKGTKWVCVTRMSEDEYKYNELKQGKDAVDFVPFTAVERELIIQEFAKAAKKRASNWLRDAIVPSVAIISFALVIICLFVFWGDIAAPAVESHELALKVSQQNQQIMQALIQNGIVLPADEVTSQAVNVTVIT
tara:strand:+ start:4387 stop:5040 length:654 start_codon:yes stop_codon:yes gene_type:complete